MNLSAICELGCWHWCCVDRPGSKERAETYTWYILDILVKLRAYVWLDSEPREHWVFSSLVDMDCSSDIYNSESFFHQCLWLSLQTRGGNRSLFCMSRVSLNHLHSSPKSWTCFESLALFYICNVYNTVLNLQKSWLFLKFPLSIKTNLLKTPFAVKLAFI